MRVTAIATAVAAFSIPLIDAIKLAPRSSNPRTVNLPIERRNVPDILAHDRARLRKRAGTVEQTLDNEDTLYFANLTLGTPAQSLRLHIDTGSSDLWVNTPSSQICQLSANPCGQAGTYDSSASSSYRLVNNDFNISYVDGSGAVGDYVSDTMVFGGVTLEDFQFGVGLTSSSAEGVLGIGYVLNEVQVGRAGLDPYPNLPVALVNGGHIASNAYSLWLNDLDASTGTILFGGVNTAKYQGDLATLPVLPVYGDYYQLSIAMTGLTVAGRQLQSSSLPGGVLLDSGSTLCYLPNDLATAIYDQVQAVYVSQIGAAYAVCDLRNEDSTMEFSFSGMTISVPYNELFLDAGTDRNGNPLTFDDGTPACLFGIAPNQGSTSILGDTFLRSAYVVYDLANNEISLAQTVFNATANDVREIGSGSGSVPGAVAVTSAVSTVAGATGGGRLGGASGTVTGLSNPTATDSAASSARKPVLGAVVAVAAAILVL